MSSELMKPTSVVSPARMPKFPEVARTALTSDVERNDRVQGGEGLPRAESDQAGENKVKEAVGNLNDFVQKLSRTLQFSVDEESGRTVIKVVDSETKQIIRQIPPEEVLALAKNLANGEGVILREQA
jgi:flagellar protein FlaG